MLPRGVYRHQGRAIATYCHHGHLLAQRQAGHRSFERTHQFIRVETVETILRVVNRRTSTVNQMPTVIQQPGLDAGGADIHG